MSRVRFAVALGLIATLVGALVFVLVRGGGTGGAPPPAPAVAAATATPASPSPTASPLVVPSPKNTGRDFDRIWREISAFKDWLWAHPDPDLVDLIYDRQCECYQDAKNTFLSMKQHGIRFQDEGFKVHSVRVLQDLGKAVRIEVIDERTPQVLVDSAGQVVRTTSGVPPQRSTMLIELQQDGRWRVLSAYKLGPA